MTTAPPLKKKRKKLKLERHARVGVSDPEREAATLRETRERQDLVNRLVKVGTTWRYLKTTSPQVDDDDDDEEVQEEAEPEEEEEEESLEVPAGAIVGPAFEHPELRPFIRIAHAGLDKRRLTKVMENMGMDPSVLTNPYKQVVIPKHLVAEQKKKKLGAQPDDDVVGGLVFEADDSKTKKVLRRQAKAVKHDPSVSLQKRQLDLLRTADLVSKFFKTRFETFAWRTKLGNDHIGYAIDTADVALARGVDAILGDDLKRIQLGDDDSEKKKNDEEEMSYREDWSHTTTGAEDDDDKENAAGVTVPGDGFIHGSMVYKAERFIAFLQVLGYIASLEVDWPPGIRWLMNWTTGFLDGHWWPTTGVFKVLERIKRQGLITSFVPTKIWSSDEYSGQVRSSGPHLSTTSVDLYFYRDVIKYVYSIALGPTILAALLFLWEIKDYTDPAVTDRWLVLHIEKWWAKGVPRALGYVVFYFTIIVGLPAGIFALTFGDAGDPLFLRGDLPNSAQKHATSTLIVGGTFAFYAWTAFVIFGTLWRIHFRSKVVHNTSYTAIVVLKETIKTKNTICFVLLFLTYMPTCLYVVGSLLPMHSVKLWEGRHSASSATEPLERSYYHVPCYFLSFPPRVRPKHARSRRSRMPPPGFAAYAPHPYHPHVATNRIDCSNPAGVLVFAASSVVFVLYLLGLPYVVWHLTGTATTQLHECDWWQNYQTAWRRFGNVLKDCEDFSLEDVVLTTVKLFKHNFQDLVLHAFQSALKVLWTVLSTISRVLRWALGYLFPWRWWTALTSNADKRREANRRKYKQRLAQRRGTANVAPTKMEDDGDGQIDEKSFFSTPSGHRLADAITTEHSVSSSLTSKTSCESIKPLRKRLCCISSSKWWSSSSKKFASVRRRVVTTLIKNEKGSAQSFKTMPSLDSKFSQTKKLKKFVVRHRKDETPTGGLRLQCWHIIHRKSFHIIIGICVAVSLSPLVFPDLAKDQKLLAKIIVTWICGIIFFFEMIVKWIALTPKKYFHSKFNTLDFCLVVLWLLEIFLQSGTNLNFLRSLRALKSARMLRMARMARTLRVLKFSQNGALAPYVLYLKRWVLRWVADTPPSDVLLKKLEKSERAGAWRIQRSLPAKIEHTKKAFLHAKREYAISFDEFTRDHELVIEDVDVVVDTSALGYLISSFKANASFWRVVLLGETLVFSIVAMWLRASQLPWIQCLGLAVAKLVFVIATIFQRPYMYKHEKQLDEVTRTATILMLLFGAVLDLLPNPKRKPASRQVRGTLDVILVVILVQAALRVLYLLRVHDLVRDVIQFVVRSLDASVLKLVSESLDVKCYVVENSNLGFRLCQQWDDLLQKQWATGFLAWPTPSPRNLLTFRQKLIHVKWAALRRTYLSKFRTPTGQCILHSAMLKGEPEAVAWLLHHHPTLLDVADDQRDSPVIIALKELAKTLLAHNNEPTPQTDWKRSKLAEILLSDQIQHYRVPWSLTHYRSLGDVAVPLYGELVQQLALALNLRPPRGFVRISKWAHYPGDIPDFLGQCFLACRDRVEAPHSELGDVGARTFQALLGALAQSRTSITKPSNFFTYYPIYIVRFIASFNRLKDDAGLAVATALRTNHSLVYLDLRHNHFTDASGPDIADAMLENKSLTMVTLAHNRLGNESGEALAAMLRDKGTHNMRLKTLNLSLNRMGPRLSWRNNFDKITVPSAGPSLCEALRYNTSLTNVNLSDNGLGPETAVALAKALRFNGNSRLLALGMAGNNLGPTGGKSLAHTLKSKVNLTRVDAARNCFGAAVGVALAGALKKSRSLAYLDVSHNVLGSKVGRAIALALKDNGTLTSLRADGNSFGPDVLRAFAETLEVCPTIAVLSLAGNSFAVSSFEGGQVDGVGTALGRALKRNATLTRLDLRHRGGGGGGDQQTLGFFSKKKKHKHHHENKDDPVVVSPCEQRDGGFPSEELVSILDGFGSSRSLTSVSFDGQPFNNAAVLQLTNALDRSRRRRRRRERPTTPKEKALIYSGRLAEKRVGECLVFVGLADCQLGPRAGPIAVGALLSLGPGVKILKLAGNNMGPKLGDHLAQHIASPGCALEEVDLGRNHLGEEGGLKISAAMEKNTSLTDIDLAENQLTAKVGAALADALCELVESGFVARAAHVQRFVLAGNDQIGTKAAADLCFALRSPQTQHVDLSGNGIGPEAGQVIAACLRRNTIQWRHLNLDGNCLGKDGVNPIFWALRRNSSLVELRLSSNDIGPDFGTDRDEIDDHGNSLASAVEHNFALQTLHLNHNAISPDCGYGLCIALDENPALTELDFEDNDLDAAAAKAMATKLEHDDKLKFLSFKRNDVGWEGGFAIAQALELNQTLVFLDLSYNNIGDGGPIAGRAFGDTLTKNLYLRHLRLEGCFLGPEGGKAIASALAKNNTLLTLVATDNHFDLDVGRHFLTNLATNTALVDCRLSREEVGADICLDLAALMKARALAPALGATDLHIRLDAGKSNTAAH